MDRQIEGVIDRWNEGYTEQLIHTRVDIRTKPDVQGWWISMETGLFVQDVFLGSTPPLARKVQSDMEMMTPNPG